MEIPLHARVDCADGACGESTYVILDPETRKVSHFVLKENDFPNDEWIVPLDVVVESEPDRILIRLEGKDLEQLKRFTVSEYLPGDQPFGAYPPEGYMVFPATAPIMPMPLETQQNPPGTLAISRGAEVRAMDGEVGKVDEFLIDPLNNRITHLILREGGLFDRREVTIPVDQIERIEEETVYLKLSRDDVAHLPDRRPDEP